MTRAQSEFVDTVLMQYEYGDHIRHILGKLLVEKILTGADVSGTGDGFVVLPLETAVKQIVYEVTNDVIETIPLDFNDIHDTTRKNPFRVPNADIAYRVTLDNNINLFTSETLLKYHYIYCKVPGPIILENLPHELKVQGLSVSTTSELPYDSILQIINLAAQELFNDKARFAPKQQKEQEKI